jgi:O-antigen/teichoic acid export membrane protein
VRGSLRSNFSWTLVGNLAYATCQWVLVVAFAKLGSVEMVGRFTLAVAVCSPVMLATGLGLRTIQANDVAGERPFGVYFGLRIVTTALAIIAIAALAMASDRAAIGIVLLFALAKAAEALGEPFWGQLQQHEQMAPIARSLMLRGTLGAFAVVGLLAATHSLAVAIAGLAVAWTVVLVMHDLVVARRFEQPIRPRFERAPLIALATTAFPLGVVLMTGSYAANAPRYFIVHFHGERELGLFAAIANLMLIGTTLMTALGQAAAPRLARAYLDRDRGELVRLVRTLLAVACGLGVAGIAVAAVAGGPALALLYTREYADHTDVLIVIMLAGLVTNIASVFGVVVTASGDYMRQVWLQAINLVVAVGLAWLLVPSYGALGAAWALFAAAAATAIAFGYLAVLRVRALA